MLHYRTTRLTSVCAQAASTYTDTHTFTFFLACTQKHVHTRRCSSPFHGAAVYRLFQGSVSRRTQAIKQCITGSHCSYGLVIAQHQNNFISRYLKDRTLICMPVNHCVILTSQDKDLECIEGTYTSPIQYKVHNIFVHSCAQSCSPFCKYQQIPL